MAGVAAAVGLAAVAAGVWAGQPPKGPLPGSPGPVPSSDSVVNLETSGQTRYRLYEHNNSNNNNGSSSRSSKKSAQTQPLAVLIHGISYPMDCFESLFQAFVDAGKSVLMYDVTGRGYSHSSGQPLTIDHYVRQLTELLQTLVAEESRPLHLVGWSMGTAIATRFVKQNPGRVNRLVLLAPPGGAPAQKPLAALLLHLPLGIGSALGMLAVGPIVRKLYRKEFRHASHLQENLKMLDNHTRENKSFARAVLSTLQNCPELDDNRETFRALRESDRCPRILVLWGDEDATIQKDAIDGAMQIFEDQATLKIIPGHGHSVHVVAPEKVNPHVLSFLALASRAAL